MYTGYQLSQDLDIRVRQTNSAAYFSPARKEYCLRMAIINLLEADYRSLTLQSSVDEISPLIKTYQSFTPYNNQVLLKPLHIVSITVSGGSYIITFDRPHNLDFTTVLTYSLQFRGIEGTLNMTNINGNQSCGAGATAYQLTVLFFGASGVHVANSGEAYSALDYWCSDYYHLLAVNNVCLKNLNLNIVSVKNVSYCDITIGVNNIREKEYLKFSSFGGLTGLTGYKYVKRMGERVIRIYDDYNLTTPTVVTGTYTSGGIIERKHNRGCEPLVSEQKISYYQATELFPLYECNDNRLACYSSERNTNSLITNIQYFVDYITTSAEIDIDDDVIDILQTYNMQMCNKIIEKASEYFFAINTASEDIQITEVLQ